MSLLSLYEEHDYMGEWKQPHSDRSVYGRLAFTSSRAELSLNEAFTPIVGDISISDARPTYSAVHGVSSKGEALSLLKAQSIGVGINFNAGRLRHPERLVSSWVVVGAHVVPETTYSSARFFIPGLEAWLCKPTIAQSIEKDPLTGDFTHTFVVRPPDAEVTAIPAIDAALEWGAGGTVSANRFTSIDVAVRGWVVIRPRLPQTLEWFFDQESKLATLLSFMAGTPMPVDAIQATPQESKRAISVLVTLPQAKRCDLKQPNDFLVSRGVLESDFSSIVSRWFEEVESVLVPSQLALSVISSKDLWLHVEFLSLVQALEGFHRGRFSGDYMDERDYETVKSTLMSAIPTTVASDHRDALRSRIRYGNQVSLTKRLTALRKLLGDALAELIIAADGKIPRNWIDTRNYLSHWDEELRPMAIDGQEMYNANVRMEHFIRALYLMMTGISAETLGRCLRGTSRTAQQLLQLNIIARHAADPGAPPGVLFTVTNVGDASAGATEDAADA